MIDRRTFLKFSGRGVLLVSGLSLLSSCSGVRREDLSRLNGNQVSIARLSKDEIEILHLASLAPSGHNTQPWSLKVLEPGLWVIGTDPKRWLPAVDPENREIFLGIGAFLENLVISAGNFGYKVNLEVLAKSTKDLEIVRIRLQKGKTEEIPLEKIRKRRTVRNGLLNDPIKKEDLAYITKRGTQSCSVLSTSPFFLKTHAFYFPQDVREGKYLQEGTIEANRTQAFRDPAQRELSNWIRWSNEDARKYRNGLTPASMEIEGIAGWYVRNFYDQNSFLKKGFRDQTVEMVVKQVKAGSGWLVVTAPDSSIPTLLAYGMVWQNMVLKIRDRLIAIHPMTQLLEEEPYKKQVAKDLGLTGEIQWIARIGYVRSYPDPVSLRMPVSWFLQG
jgi:hypothetical protein